MSDDRLFASNNPIRRRWYFINIVLLALIAFVTGYVFNNFVIPNARTQVYEIVAVWINNFFQIIYLITFFALIDRRLYDACGSRETKGYKNISAILKLIIFINLLTLYCQWMGPQSQLPFALHYLTIATGISNLIFLAITVIIGLIRGKITSLTYEEYKNKIKYE